MNWKKTCWSVLVAVPTMALLLAAVCFVDSLRYPRIARSTYWRAPHLLVRATAARILPGKGISRETIAAHAKRLGRGDDLTIRLLYLPDLPKGDTTIKARTFALFHKRRARSNETLFWVVVPHRDGRAVYDDRLAYEYRTGRLVCAKEHSKLGELAGG
jgi:hypothetical protein